MTSPLIASTFAACLFNVTVAADALEARWDVASLVRMTPPQNVTFDGAGMRFEIRVLQRDLWSAGFCRPGSVKTWRFG